jgi:hypothetical protein
MRDEAWKRLSLASTLQRSNASTFWSTPVARLTGIALKGALAGLLSARWLAQQEIAHGMKCSRSFCS